MQNFDVNCYADTVHLCGPAMQNFDVYRYADTVHQGTDW
jgi:hypothetical protein